MIKWHYFKYLYFLFCFQLVLGFIEIFSQRLSNLQQGGFHLSSFNNAGFFGRSAVLSLKYLYQATLVLFEQCKFVVSLLLLNEILLACDQNLKNSFRLLRSKLFDVHASAKSLTTSLHPAI